MRNEEKKKEKEREGTADERGEGSGRVNPVLISLTKSRSDMEAIDRSGVSEVCEREREVEDGEMKVRRDG